MSKIYLGTFIFVAGVAVCGVDYVNQSRRADPLSGSFGVSEYFSTISGRFGDQQAALAAEKERRSLRAMARRDFLPDAPEGWTRRGWDAAAADRLGRRYDMASDEMVPDEIKENPTLKAAVALDRAVSSERDENEVYVYEKDGAIIALRVTLLPPKGAGGISGMAMQIVGTNIEAMSGKSGFAIVKGVTYREELGLFGAGAEERSHRVFTGMIGDRIRVSARAEAEDADIFTLLNGVDYDRLNQMLDVSVAGIGGDAEIIPPELQRQEADRRVQNTADQQRRDAVEADYRMKMAALDFGHRMGSIDDENYARGKAALDEMHTRLDQIAAVTAQSDGIQIAAPGTPDTAAPSSAGGFLAALFSRFGGGNTPEDVATTASQADTRSTVRVNSFGQGTCSQTGLGKRCKIGE
ncbi:MAG: hypothetical protein WBC68_13740 [Albidovulum sp.]